jgi:predicted metal-dependent phosphoesterase TrpH
LEAIQLISNTGGVAVLAHPWALKKPVAIIRRLKEAGLHGMEVYRSDGKLAGIYLLFLLLFVGFCFW